jgi:hypothetical protein
MNNYTPIQKTLHKLSLSSTFIREATFDIEKLFFLKHTQPSVDNHVFVMGLARAGTTILLEALYNSDKFASLSYLNMPFLLSPNLWRTIRQKSINKDKIERAHGDSIMISTDSPEAFEEVFWKTLSRQDANEQFKNYIQLILHSYQKQRYLSKNNQNISRIDTIQKLLPNSKVLIIFKHPINHATSLLKQHKAFSKAQKKDKFIKNYMDWIKHSEFGLSYKPIVSEGLIYNDSNHINHWLEQWYLIHINLIKKYKNTDNVIFIDGESLRPNHPSWENICDYLSLEPYIFNFKDVRKKSDLDANLDLDLYEKCKSNYNSLLNIAI